MLSIIILTKDEERNLPHLLESARGLAPKIWIVDSGSTDSTIAIARQWGCRTVFHQWTNHAKQLNWAIEALPFDTPWIARMDADERFTPELVAELRETLPNLPEGVAGLLVKRRVYFMGRWIRYGGYYPTWLLRFWRIGQGRCEDRAMDEHMMITGGITQRLKNDIIDENHKGLTFWTDKHNHYATREVHELIALDEPTPQDRGSGLVGQAAQKRWFKEKFYARSPLFLRVFLYWLIRYVVFLGFLDGLRGFVFHFLQGFWYRFLVDAKLFEYRFQHHKDNKAAQNTICQKGIDK